MMNYEKQFRQEASSPGFVCGRSYYVFIGLCSQCRKLVVRSGGATRGQYSSTYPQAGLLTHREVQMIPLSQSPQPVEAAPLVIILQELDTACRGSTAPGSEPAGPGTSSVQTQGSSPPRGQPPPIPNTHTHTHTHTPLCGLEKQRKKNGTSTQECQDKRWKDPIWALISWFQFLPDVQQLFLP